VLPCDGLADDGGILTAEAIAGADLRGLRLAVLSACETGLGVFGLQRAFHLGGGVGGPGPGQAVGRLHPLRRRTLRPGAVSVR
jgi:hypothetical protein